MRTVEKTNIRKDDLIVKNHVKRDKITVNTISPANDVKSVSNSPIQNAQDANFCVYAGMRHAVGSIIKNEDGSEVVCSEDGSWQNKTN
ncbi:MAG: hypothetical protein WDA24_08755 [Tissierellales bacterium]